MSDKGINWKELAAPFTEEDLEWRLQSSGETNGKVWARCLAYVTNRAIMNRLDEVLTPACWKNEYREAPLGGVLCGISILIRGEWVTKWDGAENTDIEAIKGGLSGAMKRAAVQWGMGRHLYELKEQFAIITDKGAHRGKTKNGKQFKWNPPKLGKTAPVKREEKSKPKKNPDFETFVLCVAKAESLKELQEVWTLYSKHIPEEDLEAFTAEKDARKKELQSA